MKKCKVCKKGFEPRNSLQAACSPKCAIDLVNIKKRKKEKKELQDYRKKAKTLNQWIADAQIAVNAYIRIRDDGKGCISCGTLTSPQWDAGHYRSRGAAGHLRFNLLNNHKQCNKCNRFLGGNVVEYRKGLIQKIGEERVVRLENDNNTVRFNPHYCERIKKIFNKRARLYKKMRQSRGKIK